MDRAGAMGRTRPLCVYPKVAKYKGSGRDDAANLTRVAVITHLLEKIRPISMSVRLRGTAYPLTSTHRAIPVAFVPWRKLR